MDKRWTIEVLDAAGNWRQLANGKAWRYSSEANAERDLASKPTKRFLAGAKARTALIAG